MSREFAIALQFVRTEYAGLYRYAAHITLVPARLFPIDKKGVNRD